MTRRPVDRWTVPPDSDRLPELIDAKGLMAEMGITRAAAEGIMRQLRIVTWPDDVLRKTYVYRSDVAAHIKAQTFAKDQVPK
jgi:hypothetical protein